MKKIELLFICLVVIRPSHSKFQLPDLAFQSILRYIIDLSMAHSKAHLHRVAKCPTLVRTHMAGIQHQYDAIAHAHSKHAKPILALMNEICSLRKMMIRIIQVQRQQINKYWKSIRDGRKTVKRGAPASLESVTMETMVQMSLRVIQDMKDAIPSLIQPLVSRIHSRLCTLHQRMLLFKQYAESEHITPAS